MFVEDEIVPVKGTSRHSLTLHFEGMRKVAVERIETFRSDLAKNPARAMEWADGIFEAVAIKEVADMVLYMLKHMTEISDIQQSLQSSMRDKARYISNKSTSTSGNHLKESLLGQLTLALEHVEHFE